MKDLIEDIRSLSPQHVLLRFVIIASILGFAGILVIAGESSSYALIVLGVLGILCVLNPHTLLPGAVIIYCLAVWWAGVPEPTVAWAAPAALCLLLLHTACALSASAPAQATLPSAWFNVYGRRVAYVGGATIALSLVAYAHQAWGYRGGLTAVIAGLFALALGVGTHYWAVTNKQNDPAA